jgi:hypothetical protein
MDAKIGRLNLTKTAQIKALIRMKAYLEHMLLRYKGVNGLKRSL